VFTAPPDESLAAGLARYGLGDVQSL
jgi:hypothetical protein